MKALLAQQDKTFTFDHDNATYTGPCAYCQKEIKVYGTRWRKHKKPKPSIGWKDHSTVDHIVAKKFGGANHILNMILACGKCNLDKSKAEGRDDVSLSNNRVKLWVFKGIIEKIRRF